MRTGPEPRTVVGGLPVQFTRAGAIFGQLPPRSAICHRIRIFCALIVALIATGTRAATDGSAEATQASAQARAVIEWGDPDFTAGDTYLGPGPAWWLGGGKFGGDWFTGGWQVSADAVGPADLLMFLDREALTNNLWLEAETTASPDADVRLDLLDNAFHSVIGDVAGNLALRPSPISVFLPLAEFRDASVVRLRRFSGDVAVRRSVLTEAEEASLAESPDMTAPPGISAKNADDSDVSGASEAADQAVAEPAALDTDADGVPDVVELRRGSDPRDSASKNVVIHVNSDVGDDLLDGTCAERAGGRRGPLRSIGRALRETISGDIVLLKGTAPFHESLWQTQGKNVTLKTDGPITIR